MIICIGPCYSRRLTNLAVKFIAPQPEDAQNYSATYRYPKIGGGITLIEEEGKFVVHFRFNHFFSSSLDHHTHFTLI